MMKVKPQHRVPLLSVAMDILKAMKQGVNEFVGPQVEPWRVHNLRRTCVVETALKAGTVEGAISAVPQPHHRP
jgi:hypothetical protein